MVNALTRLIRTSVSNLETISAERAKEIIEMNRRGEKPLSLLEDGKAKPAKKSADLLAGADLSRFDKAKEAQKRTTNSATITVNKVVDHNGKIAEISVISKTIAANKVTTDDNQTRIVGHKTVTVAPITVLVRHNNREKEQLLTVETKADNLKKRKERKNDT